MRAKLPGEAYIGGLWPAIWMLGNMVCGVVWLVGWGLVWSGLVWSHFGLRSQRTKRRRCDACVGTFGQ